MFILFGKVAFVPEMSAMVENNKMKVPEDHGRKVNEQIQHLLKTTNEHGQKLNHFNSYLEAIIIMSNANSTCLFSVS